MNASTPSAPRLRNVRRQRGVAALTIALLIVVSATVVTFGVAQVGVGEQKGMANEARTSEAAAAADLAIDRAIIYLRQNRSLIRSTAAGGWMNAGATLWVSCDTLDANGDYPLACMDNGTRVFDGRWTAYKSPAADQALPNQVLNPAQPADREKFGPVERNKDLDDVFRSYIVARAAVPGQAMPGSTVFYVIAQGSSIDDQGSIVVRKAVSLKPLVAHTPDAPIIAAGTIGISGTLSIVANPNGGGPGVPLSAWSGDNTAMAGSMQSCHISEYLSTDTPTSTDTDGSGYQLKRCPSCECPNSSDLQISNDGFEGLDILDDESPESSVNTNPQVGVNPDGTNFPTDLFEYVFGVPRNDYETIKDQATLVTNCASLAGAPGGLYWSEVDCEIPSNSLVGTLENPITLVVENSDFRMNANSEFLGLIFAFAHDGSGGEGGAVDVKINGGPTLYGALISNQDVDLGNGNYTARYDKGVLDNLGNSASAIAEVPGSWKDYR